jgi:hypothetical protein
LPSTAAVAETEQWDVFEVTLQGPSHGNPFVSVHLRASFTHPEHAPISVRGFYNGEGIYKIRFMPSALGIWKYVTTNNVDELSNREGKCIAVAPNRGNHGPVQVRNTFHFAYADGTPYKPIGTTCYGWTSQSGVLQERTLNTLVDAPFNKVRMCVFPKRYTWNENEPPHYPFVGTPPNAWDLSRFNPDLFRNFERGVAELRDLGIQADVILFHPYDKGHWGFDRMPDEADDHYLRYVISRLAAYRNVWWSLANEYDFMGAKVLSDWDHLFQIVVEEDPQVRTRRWKRSVSRQSGGRTDSGPTASRRVEIIRFPPCGN